MARHKWKIRVLFKEPPTLHDVNPCGQLLGYGIPHWISSKHHIIHILSI